MKIILSTFAVIVLLAGWTAGAFFAGKKSVIVPEQDITVDTILIKESVRDTVLIPQIRYLARMDTVFLTLPGDTVKVEVEVPIERKVYLTDDYRATVEGFRPRLVDMEIYRQTGYITRTETIRIPERQRWGLGIQVGYGYNFDKFYPYVGVGLQYTIIGW